jgi:hypothetical protein
MFSSDRVVKMAAGAVAGSLLLGGGLLFAMEPDSSPATAGTSRAAGAKVGGGSASAFGLGGEAGIVPGLGVDSPGSLGVGAAKQGSTVSSGATGTGSGPAKGQGAFTTAGANGTRGASGTFGGGTSGGGSSNGGAQVTPPGSPKAPSVPKAPTVAVPQSVSREGSVTVAVPAVAGQAYDLCASGDVAGDGAGRCVPIVVDGTKGATLTLTWSGNASAQAPKVTPGTCNGGSTITVSGVTPGSQVKATFRSGSDRPSEVTSVVKGKNASGTASFCKKA